MSQGTNVVKMNQDVSTNDNESERNTKNVVARYGPYGNLDKYQGNYQLICINSCPTETCGFLMTSNFRSSLHKQLTNMHVLFLHTCRHVNKKKELLIFLNKPFTVSRLGSSYCKSYINCRFLTFSKGCPSSI